MKDAVKAAIAELRDGLPGHTVDTVEDSDGGAHVIVRDLDIGPGFEPQLTWVGFHITWTYPDSDVYPHFIDPLVRYVGAHDAPVVNEQGNLPKAMSRGGRMAGFDCAAIQVSRRSNHRNAETDSALQKLLRVLEFLRTR